MNDNRPNPEKLLKQIQQEETSKQFGKLKIYLGAAPGVGKTFSMLQDAHAMREKGVDVVVGIVETHGRKEIEALLKDFEILPRLSVEYRNTILHEFDLDLAVKRNPGLILIDEMAHTNASGMRHTKRWQDIKELLDRGINVETTLNVQHLESLNDVVAQILHTRVNETIPDFMLEMAEALELVDLPPEELLKRLYEGKVYFPAQVELAAQKFFRKGNLNALRQLALRVTAEHVGERVLSYREGKGIQYIWPSEEKILVCVGHKAGSAKVIRSARRMATSLQIEWIGLHVDVVNHHLTQDENNQVIQNLRLAEQLGAKTDIISAEEIISAIMKFAREKNITKIIIGKQTRSRWKELIFGSLADKLVRASGEIDVYIISAGSESFQYTRFSSAKKKFNLKNYIYSFFKSKHHFEAIRYSQHHAQTLQNLVLQLVNARGKEALSDIASRYMNAVFDAEVSVLLPEENKLAPKDAKFQADHLSEKELGVVQWVYEMGQAAGLGTDTLPFSDAIYLPLIASHGTIGVLRLHPAHVQPLFSPEEMRLLSACANQLALAIEADHLEENKIIRHCCEEISQKLQKLTSHGNSLNELNAEITSILEWMKRFARIN